MTGRDFFMLMGISCRKVKNVWAKRLDLPCRAGARQRRQAVVGRQGFGPAAGQLDLH